MNPSVRAQHALFYYIFAEQFIAFVVLSLFKMLNEQQNREHRKKMSK